MSDLFQPEAPDGYIEDVAKLMVEANWHTYKLQNVRIVWPYTATLTATSLVAPVLGFALESGMLISLLGAPRRKVRSVFLLAFIQGLVLFLGVSRLSVPLVGGAAFLFSVCTIMIFVISQTIWQTQIPQALQGRAFAIRRLIAWSTLPVAYLAAGPLADKVFEPLLAAHGLLAPTVGSIIGTGPGRGIALLFVVMGAVMLTAVSIASRYPPFWELESRMLDVGPDNQGRTASGSRHEEHVAV